MPEYRTRFSFPSELANLSLVESAIDQLLSDGLISDNLYGNVIVAATEATLNAIQHGNKSNPDKTTTVEIFIDNGELYITVMDEGNGFDYNHIPDPTDPANLDKVNGRGIFIIHSLADNVAFDSNGSILKMTFKLDIKEMVAA